MSSSIVGIIGCLLLILAFLMEMPVAFAMAAIGLAGIIYLTSPIVGLTLLAREFWQVFSTYTLSVVPMFVLMGTLAANSGISKNLYETGYAFFGRFRGGLALATTIGCGLFAAVCGSSAAEAASMSKVALPEMKKYNYDMKLATGCIAAAGTLGLLIPPSMGFIVYGFLTQVSVGRLFIAGIIPGVILTILFMFTVSIICRINPTLGPSGPPTSWKNKVKALAGCFDMLLLFILVIGGLFIGIFTPTEAGAFGAGSALLLCVIKGRINWRSFLLALEDTAVISSMFFYNSQRRLHFWSFHGLIWYYNVVDKLDKCRAFIAEYYNMAYFCYLLVRWLFYGLFLPGSAYHSGTVPDNY